MSSRLARQSLELLSASNKTNKKQDTQSDTTKKQTKIILPKINKGIKKVKQEIRYGRHQKTRLLQQEREKRENPINKLQQEEVDNDEKLKRNVQLLRKGLRSSSLERKIHTNVIKEKDNRRTKKWTSKVKGSDGDTDNDSD